MRWGSSTRTSQRVREATDIVAVVTEHLQLKRVGRRWTGLCPFHTEKSPSFSVNAEEGLYYCFGCGAKGDVITFVREIEHLDFVGAVERLAGRAGITLRYTTQGEGEGRQASRPAGRRRWRPPSTGTTSACCRRPTRPRPAKYLRGAGPRRRRRRASTASAGRPTAGTLLVRNVGVGSDDVLVEAVTWRS